MESATFLNLDLELRSKQDLAPLAAYLNKHACLLHSGEFNGTYQLTAEPNVGGHSSGSAQPCTEEFLTTIASLSSDLRALFDGSHLRVFDYGFDGGLEAPPCTVDLPAAQLARMAELGIGIRVTVYPYREESATGEEE